MSEIDEWIKKTDKAPASVKEIESSLSPQEMGIVQYHRNTIASGQVGRDPQGRPVTVYSNSIDIPEGPHKGRVATVPGYFDGGLHSDPAELWQKWGPEIDAGKWPTYADPQEANARAQHIHGIMDLEGDGQAPPSELAQWLQQDDQKLALSVQEGLARDPAQATRILQLQTKTGLPKDFIAENLDLVEQHAAKQDFNPDSFKQRSRSLAAWIAQHPDHAAAVREDLSKLSYLERQYRYIGGSFERGKQTVELSDIGQAAMSGTITPEQRARQAEIEKQLALTDNTDITGFVEQVPGQVANQLPIQLRSLGGKVKDAAIGAAAGGAAGSVAPGAGTIAGATIGAGVGWRYGAAIEAGKMEASLAFLDYEKLKDDQGRPLDRTTVLGLAGMVGVVNGALEGLTGLEKAMDKLPGVRSLSRQGVKDLLASPSARGAVLAYAKTIGSVMATEGVTEGIQSMVTHAGKVLAKATGGPTDILGEIFSMEALGEAMQEARAGAQGGGGLAVAVASPTLAVDLKRAKQAKETEQTWLEIGNVTQNTKMREALPEHLQAIIAAATKDGPIEQVYVPTAAFNTYFQSKGVDPREAAAAITGSVEAYDQAVESGQDLAIRTADYAVKLAPTEHNAFFARELRTSIDAMNAREAEEWQQSIEEQEKASAEQAGLDTATVTDGAAKVRQDIAGQLLAAGYDPAVVERYAALFEARYRARAERRGLGEDPYALFQQLNLHITKTIPEVLRTLGQKTSELDALLNRLRVGDLPKESEVFGQSLTEFLKAKGGLQDQGGELSSRNVDAARKPFDKNLIQEKGLTLDQAAELAAEAGYLEERDLAALLDAIDKDARGTPVYAPGRENAQLFDVHNNIEALKQFLADREINVNNVTNEQIKAMLGDATQQTLPAAEGQTFAQAALPETILVDGVERPTHNSEGKPIAYTTPVLENFWRWFGESKVVDAQGRPMVVYHGTDVDFTAFDKGKIKGRFKQSIGFHFTTREAEAEYYTDELGDGSNRIIKVVYLKGDNPLIIETDQVAASMEADLNRAEIIHKLVRAIEAGKPFDSVIIKRERGDEYDGWNVIVFEPNQIKALDNRGTFSPTSPNILHQTEGTTAKGSITFGDNMIDLKLLEGADLSTFIHETGHLYLNELITDATTPGVPQQLRDDLDSVLKWMGLEVRVADGADKIKAAVQVQQHEQFARGFELYALEGKAPSQAMREAFARFRQWLIQVYRLFRQGLDAAGVVLDVKLTKEVREVLDRMIATDQEIDAAAQEAEVLPLFTDAVQAGMSESQWANYQELVGKASRTAREQLQAKLMAQLNREKETWWKERRAKMLEAVTAEVNDQPDYTALSVLQTGKFFDGSALPEGIQPMKLDRKAIADTFGKDFLKRMPRKTTAAKGGVHFETVAQQFGYTNGQDFIMALVNARPKAQLIEAETDRRMQEEYGDMRFDGTMAEAARVAVLNEYQEEVLAAELAALNKKRREVAPFLKAAMKDEQDARRGALSALMPPLETVRETARQQVARTPVRRLQPYAHFIAGQKASREAIGAIAKEDYVAAALWKQKELLSMALYREATAAQTEVEKIAEHMRGLTKKPAQERLGKAGGDYLDQINELLERYEFTHISNKRLDSRRSLAEWVKEKELAGETLGEEFSVPESVLAESKRANYRELSYDEVRGIFDTVKQIEHFAALKNKLLKAQKARDKEAAREALIAAIETNLEDKGPPPLTKAGLTTGDKVTKLAQQFDASLLKMEQVIEWLDGGPVGPWHDYFWNPAADAQAAEYDATEKITAKIAQAVAGIPAEIRKRMLDTVKIAGIDAVITRKDLLGVALNTGNQGNYDKLLKGMGWTDEQVQAMTDQLTAEEWQFVQHIWDTLESLAPELDALTKRLTGLPMEKVQPRPIENRHGKFAGGYYPIMYSAVLSDQGQLQLASNLGGLVQDGYTRATIPSGHRKARVEGFARPFDLDLDRLPTHIAGVVKDLTHREWLIDANWIANDPEIRAVLQRRLGDPLTVRMTEWVRQVVNDRNSASLPSLGVWNRMVEHFRFNVMVVGMGFKFSTLLSQMAGVAPAIEVIGGEDHDGAKWFTKGLGEVLRRPQSAYDFMTAKSGEMRHRLATRDRDIRDHLRLLEGRTDLVSQIKETSLMAIGYVELMVSMPSWFGAYHKALAAGMDDEQAVRMGDRAVRLGQGAGGAKDLAAVMAKSEELLRILTMFYSPFSAMFARLRSIGHDYNGAADLPGTAFRLFWVVLVPATLGELAAGRGPDDKDEESWLAWWLKAVSVYPFLAVPLMRDVVSAVTSEYGYQFTPMAQALKVTADTVKTAKAAALGDKELGDFATKAVQAMSYLIGLPTGQLTITATYLYDLATGNAHPDNLFQFAKGLLYRRTKEERGQ